MLHTHIYMRRKRSIYVRKTLHQCVKKTCVSQNYRLDNFFLLFYRCVCNIFIYVCAKKFCPNSHGKKKFSRFSQLISHLNRALYIYKSNFVKIKTRF
ncbi:hypothetical protein Hanom_Chr06g00517131 [Helianthus anomalus]